MRSSRTAFFFLLFFLLKERVRASEFATTYSSDAARIEVTDAEIISVPGLHRLGFNPLNDGGKNEDAVERHLEKESLAKFIGKNLAEAALGKIGGDATGWILNQLGFGDPSGGKLDEIKTELAQEKTALNNIDKKLGGLKTQLDAGFKKVLKAIEDSAEKVQFNAWVVALNRAISELKGLSDQLLGYSNAVPNPSLQDDIRAFRSGILSKVPSVVREINGALMGTTFSEGMISLFFRVYMKLSTNIQEHAESLDNFSEYYHTFQVLGYN